MNRILLIFLILFASCEIEVPLDKDKIQKHAVVNGLFTTDSLFKISVTESRDIFNDKMDFDKYIDATVDLYGDGQLIETLTYLDSGLYTTTGHKAKPGKRYQVKVQSKYGTSTATSTIPTLVVPDTLRYTINAGFLQTGQAYDIVNIDLKDPGGEENFYAIYIQYRILDSVWKINENWELPITRFEGYYSIYSYDPAIQIDLESEESLFDKNLVVSDKLIDGKAHSLEINITSFSQMAQNIRHLVHVNFHSVSKEYYQYMKKRIQYNKQSGSAAWEDFSEPVQVYTNVNNGYGIFAGYVPYRYTLYIDADTIKAYKE